MSHLNRVLENKSEFPRAVCMLEGDLLKPGGDREATSVQETKRG